MSSREKIINTVRINKPPAIDLPVINEQMTNAKYFPDMLQQFKEIAESNGCDVVIVNNQQDLLDILNTVNRKETSVINTLLENNSSGNILSGLTAGDLGKVDKVIIKGDVAVAENGAIWIDEKAMVNRLLPFICQHLILVIDEGNIVSNMHNAYDNIANAFEGFGVFIAGPSKTADIEQSLVIGAHGALKLTIYVVKN
ncbi:MAG: LutC/YkgG family protein [Ginsengibacter sp.]